jgi:hypothetical protein
LRDFVDLLFGAGDAGVKSGDCMSGPYMTVTPEMCVEYEEVYLQDYETVPQAVAGLGRYFKFYNRERLRQSLDYRTPEAVYRLTA